MELHIVKSPVIWVLVADAKTAQIYMPKLVEHRIPLAGNSKHRHMNELHERMLVPILARPLSAESAKYYEVERNKTCIVFENFSSARHMAEPHLDARKEVKRHFARRIADFIGRAKDGEAFDWLVLVAPPEMLGEIDAMFHENIRRKITAKVAKELTHESPEALTKHLEGYY